LWFLGDPVGSLGEPCADPRLTQGPLLLLFTMFFEGFENIVNSCQNGYWDFLWASCVTSGASWESLGSPLGPIVVPRGSFGILGDPLRGLWGSGRSLGGSLGSLGGALEISGEALGSLGEPLESLCGPLCSLGGSLEGPWESLGGPLWSLGGSWGSWGVPWGSLGSAEVPRGLMLQKCCK
jgi:hypothetical protein